MLAIKINNCYKSKRYLIPSKEDELYYNDIVLYSRRTNFRFNGHFKRGKWRGKGAFHYFLKLMALVRLDNPLTTAKTFLYFQSLPMRLFFCTPKTIFS